MLDFEIFGLVLLFDRPMWEDITRTRFDFNGNILFCSKSEDKALN